MILKFGEGKVYIHSVGNNETGEARVSFFQTNQALPMDRNLIGTEFELPEDIKPDITFIFPDLKSISRVIDHLEKIEEKMTEQLIRDLFDKEIVIGDSKEAITLNMLLNKLRDKVQEESK